MASTRHVSVHVDLPLLHLFCPSQRHRADSESRPPGAAPAYQGLGAQRLTKAGLDDRSSGSNAL